MTDTPAKPTCPVCWSTRCLATKQNGYRHRWEDGPMAAAHARWKDHRTPPAGSEEAIERGLAKPESVRVSTNDDVRVSHEPAPLSRTQDDVRLSDATCEECSITFKAHRSTARFCSDACRKKASRRVEASEAGTA